MQFSIQIIGLCNSVMKRNLRPFNIVACFEGTLKKSEDMELRFESLIVNYLYTKRCKVSWLNESNGIETYDLLVEPVHGVPFEVECKSFSAKKGVVSFVDGTRLLETFINHQDNF